MVALGKTTAYWKSNTSRWGSRGSGSGYLADEAPVPWPTLCNDGRLMRVSDPIAATAASVESLRALKKKQYAEERRASNGLRISRCPFKGDSPLIPRKASNRPFNPNLFTIPNFLTPEDCERLITASEVNFFRRQCRDSVASVERCHVYTGCYSQNTYLDMWTPGLRSLFADIRIKQEGNAFAVGAESYINIVRYGIGGKPEPETFEVPLYKTYSQVSNNFYTFPGYRILVYLNGSSGDVGGGETHAFHLRQHVSGYAKQSVAEIAPETGMAVCMACGAPNPIVETMPITNGVLYMAEVRVNFSNYTNADIAKYKAEHPRKGRRKV